MPTYTTDVHLFATIAREMELFYNHLEEASLLTYVEIQQEALHKEKEFIGSLIDHAVDGIFAFDQALRVTEWNLVMKQWLNRKKKRSIRKKSV